MTRVRPVLWFWLTFALILFAGSVKAETIPATNGSTYTDSAPALYYADASGAGTQSSTISAGAACAKWVGPTYTLNVTAPPTISGTFNIGTCTSSGGTVVTIRVAMTCPSGYTVESGTNKCTKTGLSCPAGQNWTLSGSSCTRPDCAQGETLNASTGICEAPCKQGQTRVNGVCTCDSGAQTGDNGECCPVAGSGGGAPMQWCYVDNSAASSCDSAGANGCKVRCNNVTFQKGASGDQVQIYPKQALGQSCSYTGTKATNQGGGPLNNDELKEVSDATKDPAKAKSPEACLAAGMGYITGSSGTNCVPGGDTGVTKKETSEKTNTDGTGTSSETTTKDSSQTPTGGETNETTTKTNPDGSTTTTTTKTTCADDGTCKTTTTETNKDANGNTTGTKTGTGQESTSDFCKKNPTSELCKGTTDTCKDHPDRIGCATFGEVTEQAELGESEKGVSSISVVGVTSNASCPGDLQLAHGMTFSFAPFCDYATALSPIIITLAWLSAGFLIFGFKD